MITKKNTFSIFFDGTGNGPNDEFPSNVFKLYKLFDATENRNEFLPRSLYLPGPGATEYDVMVGNLFGSGIWENIKSAYRELTRVFNGCSGKELNIAIFGFSRGGYTAHLFAWLLYCCGIPEDMVCCDEFVDMFKKNPNNPLQNSRDAYTKVHSISFIGVWDIVKSVKPNKDYYDGKLPPIVKQAYHAMALDEMRKKFPVMKWNDNECTTLRQMWFAGVHSDVGGGYQRKGLSDIAFKWMYEIARENKLPCKDALPEIFQEDCNQDLNDPFEDNPRWNLLGREARLYEGEAWHPSLAERHEQRADYTPMAIGWNWTC